RSAAVSSRILLFDPFPAGRAVCEPVIPHRARSRHMYGALIREPCRCGRTNAFGQTRIPTRCEAGCRCFGIYSNKVSLYHNYEREMKISKYTFLFDHANKEYYTYNTLSNALIEIDETSYSE